jgi:DNA-binding LytR/AlgR family response regulator
MTTVNCAIIEDDELDRKVTERFVRQIPFLHLTGSFENVLDAQSILKNNNIRLLLMDIDMPVLNGLEFFKSLANAPLCIFITAHPEYALEGFETQALDYIVKPLKLERFEQAVNRAKEYLEIREKAALYDIEFGKNTLSIKEGTATIQLKITDIIYLEALGDYTKVITAHKMYLTLHNLKSFIEKLPEQKFLRIHRSFAVAIDRIKLLKDNELVLDNVKLPVGKTFRRAVNKYLVPK